MQLNNCIRLGLNGRTGLFTHAGVSFHRSRPPLWAPASPCHPVPASSHGPESWQRREQVPAGLEALCPALRPRLLACPLLCSTTDRSKTRALESVCFRPVRPFPADGAVVQDAVGVSFFVVVVVVWFQGPLGVGELVENSFCACKEAGVEGAQEPR